MAHVKEVFENLYGKDLEMLDFEYVATSKNDLKLTEGADAIKANLTRALITEPGDLFWAPEYGIGLAGFLNRSASAAMFDEVRTRIKSTLASNPDVDEINNVEVYEQGDGLYIIDVEFTLGGQPEQINLSLRRDER